MYNEIKNRIDEYLTRSEIVSDEMVVSAYDLFLIIYMSLEELLLIYQEY